MKLLRATLVSGVGWLTVRSAYVLLFPGFVQRRPVLAASVVGSAVGLQIPCVLTALSGRL